jgi:hypothetical protein
MLIIGGDSLAVGGNTQNHRCKTPPSLRHTVIYSEDTPYRRQYHFAGVTPTGFTLAPSFSAANTLSSAATPSLSA